MEPAELHGGDAKEGHIAAPPTPRSVLAWRTSGFRARRLREKKKKKKRSGPRGGRSLVLRLLGVMSLPDDDDAAADDDDVTDSFLFTEKTLSGCLGVSEPPLVELLTSCAAESVSTISFSR
ncbi:unnamed protein product [Pleuronectes platessa]|uniref:Uncharacterized protein n=1 Tax=Pleuronectes platessa TaxID=8262 RepID=A0A9N7VNI0_PLEPL|nr:unnamed protein product [Pleuronectes platessa]